MVVLRWSLKIIELWDGLGWVRKILKACRTVEWLGWVGVGLEGSLKIIKM